MMRTVVLMGLVGCAAAAKGLIETGDKDFQEKVIKSGKNSFVKFYAPWCGHCKAMAGDWKNLAKAYADNDNVQIVDVDCIDAGKSICSQMGVQGFPTLKYFTEKTGKSGAAYQGGRDLASLKTFVEKNLNTKSCNVKTLEGCSTQEKNFIEKQKDRTPEERSAERKEKEDELKKLKKERTEAQAELKAKEKEWTKKEKLLSKAIGLLKQFDGKKK